MLESDILCTERFMLLRALRSFASTDLHKLSLALTGVHGEPVTVLGRIHS